MWRRSRGRTDPEQPPAGGFSISDVRTAHVHAVCSVRTLTWEVLIVFRVLCQCPPISDILYVNSRTLDIGKASVGRLIRPLVLGVELIADGGKKIYNKATTQDF